MDLLRALILGIVEGVTEFIPVSSTGHLILVGHWLGFTGDRATVFEIVIQLGAILAVVWLYRDTFVHAATAWTRDRSARRLVTNLAIAFLPAAAVGFLAHRWITAHLFNPTTVAAALALGGIAILVVERFAGGTPRIETVDDLPPRTALGIGLAQVLALIPGVSRSGATILGGLGLGLSRPAATEFSFFLAVPVMLAATGLDLVTNLSILSTSDLPVFAVGLVASFASALIVIQAFLRFVSGHSFRGFAWYRILLGGLLLALQFSGWAA
jgi:undecaprenyl-diphosphatase